MRRGAHWLERPINPLSPLTIALAICLGLAFLSTEFGLAAIIGAFLAGMIASETPQREELEHQMQPLLAFLTPFFFVVTGAKIDLALFASAAALWMLARRHRDRGGLETRRRLPRRAVARPARRDDRRRRHGAARRGRRRDREPRARRAACFSNETYAVIVAMSLLTSMITPPVLAVLLRREASHASRPAGSTRKAEDVGAIVVITGAERAYAGDHCGVGGGRGHE